MARVTYNRSTDQFPERGVMAQLITKVYDELRQFYMDFTRMTSHLPARKRNELAQQVSVIVAPNYKVAIRHQLFAGHVELGNTRTDLTLDVFIDVLSGAPYYVQADMQRHGIGLSREFLSSLSEDNVASLLQRIKKQRKNFISDRE